MAAIGAAAPPLRGADAVLYGFAADPVCEALATSGIALLREPQPDVALAQWLRHLGRGVGVAGNGGQAGAPDRCRAAAPLGRCGPVRLRGPIVHDCLRMPAARDRLLMLLSHFEVYSAQCEHRNAADAELHADLSKSRQLPRPFRGRNRACGPARGPAPAFIAGATPWTELRLKRRIPTAPSLSATVLGPRTALHGNADACRISDPSERYARVPASADGIGKRYMGREISA